MEENKQEMETLNLHSLNVTVKQLKEILNRCPDNMKVVIPVVDEEDVNNIYGFRYVRVAGILKDRYSSDKVLCLNGSAPDSSIKDQMKEYDTADLDKELFNNGGMIYDV